MSLVMFTMISQLLRCYVLFLESIIALLGEEHQQTIEKERLLRVEKQRSWLKELAAEAEAKKVLSVSLCMFCEIWGLSKCRGMVGGGTGTRARIFFDFGGTPRTFSNKA